MEIGLKFTDMKMFDQLMNVFYLIYNHQDTPEITKTYIKFELGKLFGPEYDIGGFLRTGDVGEDEDNES